MATRTAKAEWEGTLKDGKGTMNFSNYSGPFSFVSRFEEGWIQYDYMVRAVHVAVYVDPLIGEPVKRKHGCSHPLRAVLREGLDVFSIPDRGFGEDLGCGFDSLASPPVPADLSDF